MRESVRERVCEREQERQCVSEREREAVLALLPLVGHSRQAHLSSHQCECVCVIVGVSSDRTSTHACVG